MNAFYKLFNSFVWFCWHYIFDGHVTAAHIFQNVCTYYFLPTWDSAPHTIAGFTALRENLENQEKIWKI